MLETKLDMGWMLGVVYQAIVEYNTSIAKYPNIRPGEEFNGYPAPK